MLKAPWTTASRSPETCSVEPFPTARDTLDWLDTVITDARVEPTKKVAQARADLAAIAAEEAEQLADVEALRDSGGVSMTDALSVLQKANAGRTTVTNEQRYEATAKLLTGTNPALASECRRMANQIKFRQSKAAARRLRQLGDDILELLNAWIARLMAELAPLATKVAEGGWALIYETQAYRMEHYEADDPHLATDIANHAEFPERTRKYFEVMRTAELTHELNHVAETAAYLRERGYLPRAADENFRHEFYSWKNVHKLPPPRYAVHTPESASLTIAQAIAAGAEPVARSARQAEAAAPHLAHASL